MHASPQEVNKLRVSDNSGAGGGGIFGSVTQE